MIDAEYFFSNIFAIGVKASSIAHIIRKESSLFDLLIENKNGNEFFSFDCKTFADVLIQQTAKHDLNNLYPNFGEKLLGEEESSFTNKLNCSIEVKICENVSLTKNLILKIVANHDELAEKLSQVIHRNIEEFFNDDFVSKLKIFSKKSISLDSVEMWIDPIDSTLEYVSGFGLNGTSEKLDSVDSIKNATVLLGVYNSITGIPFAGVICQPFHEIKSDGNWNYSCYWGVCFDHISLYSSNIIPKKFSIPGQVITSYREVENLLSILNNSKNSGKWNITSRSGAGFKLLSLLTSETDICLLTMSSTYKWDTCGPHGILLSVGGGLVDYNKIMSIIENEINKYVSESEIDQYIKDLISSCQVQYNTTRLNACNHGGFIGYSNPDALISVIRSIIRR